MKNILANANINLFGKVNEEMDIETKLHTMVGGLLTITTATGEKIQLYADLSDINVEEVRSI